MDDQSTIETLIERAREAVGTAYAPYSGYTVGAALRTADGTVFTGCNVENANYSNSVHAEELAVTKAVEAGHREFSAIAVSTGERDGITPCGMCRQTLAEFCEEAFAIYCDEDDVVATYTLGELLPNTIGGEDLDR